MLTIRIRADMRFKVCNTILNHSLPARDALTDERPLHSKRVATSSSDLLGAIGEDLDEPRSRIAILDHGPGLHIQDCL